jgi:hypothetical protein
VDGALSAMFKVIVAVSAICAALGAHASTSVSCLLAVQVKEKFVQPIQQTIVKAKVVEVKDNVNGRNDSDCKGLFEKTKMVWLNVSNNSLRDKPAEITVGQKMWVGFIYGDDRGGAVWRDYSVITQQQYLEKKNGIQ